MNQPAKTFSASSLARWIAGAKPGAWRLDARTLSGPGLPDPRRQYGPEECLGDVRVHLRLFWRTVSIQTDTKTIAIRGLDRHRAEEWADALNQWQTPARLTSLEPFRQALKQVGESAAELWDGSRFVRGSEQQNLLAQITGALASLDSGRWASWADETDRHLEASVAGLDREAATRRQAANDAFRGQETDRFSRLFDTVESNPLTAAQRRACVSLDDNTLVLAGAGTGKTSVMIGRMAYLLESGAATPDQILAVAYNRDAAEELRTRAEARLASARPIDDITIRTFHALGTSIIAAVEDRKPSVSLLASDPKALESLVAREFKSLLKDPRYFASYMTFAYHYEEAFKTIFDFANAEDYERDLHGRKRRAMNGTLVKSAEELQITNWLIRHGVDFQYEALYPVDTATREYAAYKPDFTIRLSPGSDAVVYLEHFGIDAQGRPPPFFSIRESKRYLEGINWKRDLHQAQQTKLLETYSYEFQNGAIFDSLAKRLKDAGVALSPISDAESLKLLADNGTTTAFVQLCVSAIKTGRELDAFSALEAKLSDDQLADCDRSRLIWRLLKPLLDRYESELRSTGEVDFGEMLHRAGRYVTDGSFRSPWRHILVDEFQDISEPRAALILALRDQVTGATLCCVGDDWQSIYRFSGADVRYTTDFAQRIGFGTTVALDRTFRFNDQIDSVATAFVTRNPEQSRKVISSIRLVAQPAVSLVSSADENRALEMIARRLDAWAKERGQRYTVRVLARYNYELDEAQRLTNQTGLSENLDFSCSTVHAAKGLEADFVILVGLGRGRNGFPAEKPVEPFTELLLPPVESFPDAEERRLFYVALTRARHRVYLVYDREDCSSFVSELSRGDYAVETDEFRSQGFHQPFLPLAPCPKCATGQLRVRQGPKNAFIGCNRYPLCAYTERGCGDCGGILLRVGAFRVCADDSCAGIHLACPECGSPMQVRRGPHGVFFGCGNYGRADIDLRCTATAQMFDLPAASAVRAATHGG